ncbi:DNA primase [Nostoc flagelliforme CCNUN1]|uniref:DNA primase n=1 Tax=Nostoc flagelliforme CCNUN1 TaxID=2038116 RepID=A0A2K8T0V0_9NOSO|nr:VapE domain-containing protein [Nostoc flagelliforme]AUB41301.1 DNA primase [Nostoc flagelliforme CCNUN1]
MILSTLSVVNGVLERHWKEFKSSAISDTIIDLNFRTIEDSRELDRVLNRNTKSRRKHSDHLVPAWCVSGVDPLTGENTLEGVQVKPDTPSSDKKGKLQKYIGATGANTAPLFLNTGIENFWKAIIEDKSKPVLITEGAKKAGAGLALGIPTISIPGVTTCRKNGRLHYWLEAFAGFGRTFYLAFDADIIDKRPVQYALISLARDLSATGSKVMIITLPSLELKGMDDFIATKGGDEFKKLIDEASTIEEWKKELDEKRKAQEIEFDDEERKSRMSRAYKIISQGWGDSIRLNTLKKYIEFDNSRMDLDLLKLYIALEFDMDISKEDAHSIVMSIAKANAYNPVVEYLDDLEARFPSPDLSILNNLALRYFGTNDPLHNTYIKKSLIAAVSRARRPGEKAEDICVLVGEQGLRKSTFWKELFGADWFTDELSDSSEKDELMKLHYFWGIELAEIEHIYKKKDVSSFKKFLSNTVDPFRIPYDREIKEHPRACLLVATSNEQELLNDPTGSRRFFVVPVLKEIPIEELIRERDLIWAAANQLYQMGHQWWLTRAESAQQAEANKDYQTSDPWEEKVLSFIRGRDWVTTHDILFTALGIETGRQDIMSQKRVAGIMKINGWHKQRKWIDGHALQTWVRKVEKTSGSCGSCGSNQSAQGFEHDPHTKTYVDHVDHIEPDKVSFVTNEQFSDPHDPHTKTYVDHLEPSHSKNDPHDPHDPHTFQTFPEKNSVQHEPTEKPNTISSKKDFNFWLIDPTPLSLHIATHLGDIICTATPVATILNAAKMPGGYECLMTWQWPTGGQAQTTVGLTEAGDFEEGAKKIAKEWLKKQEPWQPQVNRDAMYGGELVKIVGRWQGKWQVELSSGRFQYVRANQLSQPKNP